MAYDIVVIGGGPAGLFAARLLALRHPDWRVTVHERTDPSHTFGFGVGLTGGLLTAVMAVDPETAERIQRGSARVPVAEFRLGHSTVRIPGFHRGVAVSRAGLLDTLVDQARAAGVRVELDSSVTLEQVGANADLVIAADGVSSAAREARREVFEPTVTLGRGIYMWCGSEAQLEGTVFHPVDTEHGVFTAHAYPYGEGRTALVIETDSAALTSLEAAVGAAPVTARDSDEQSLAFLSVAFRELLGGKPLVGNRSQWFRFSTVRCRRWVDGKVVLLGDAAANADPSLGSGTKLAMESAIALADALDDEPRSIAEALRAFEDARRPAVDRFQRWALRSQRWWDSFPRRLDLSGERIAFAFLSRLEPFSLDASGPSRGLVRAAVASWAGVSDEELPDGDLTDWILARTLDRPVGAPSCRLVPESAVADGSALRLTVDLDDPWGEEADAVLERVRLARAAGAGVVVLDGAHTSAAIDDRIDVAERIRLETGCAAGVSVGPDAADAVASGLVAGRIDFAVRAAVTAPRRDGKETADAH
ncbi:FAD-dependent monooxygenase [Tsukamurella soli]|uniref:FAD-binding domain-containing protein n=1 Tax=Tsukamurella soli TaxID=644556 RepID=A0ABP8JKB7_9ACTN